MLWIQNMLVCWEVMSNDVDVLILCFMWVRIVGPIYICMNE